MRRAAAGMTLFAGLLSSALAACSAVEDGFVTVGIRPKDGAAASDGSAAAGAGGLPVPGRDVMMNQAPGGEPEMPSASSGAGASGAAAGTFASAGSGGAGAAGDGSAGIGAAGTGGAPRANEDECGAIPSQPAGGVTSGRVSGAGLLEYDVDAPNVFLGLRTTLAVPAEPPPSGHIFIWPGIQPTPFTTSFQPIGNGALLSVLAWGPLCPPEVPASYSTWWVAPMYTNLSSSDPQYSGCHSGEVVRTEPAQLLDIEMRLDGTTWVQTVVHRTTGEASAFSLDLKGQDQGRVFFHIELQTSNKPTEDVIFTNTVLSMAMSDPGACEPVMRGVNDFASRPRVSADGRHCCIDRIVLRAPGVAPTTMDPP